MSGRSTSVAIHYHGLSACSDEHVGDGEEALRCPSRAQRGSERCERFRDHDGDHAWAPFANQSTQSGPAGGTA